MKARELANTLALDPEADVMIIIPGHQIQLAPHITLDVSASAAHYLEQIDIALNNEANAWIINPISMARQS